MSDLKEFIDNTLYHRLFQSIDTVFPEFQFLMKNGNWVSSNRLRLDGREGTHEGSVYVYRNTPFYIKDFSSGGKAIVAYLQETGKASSWIEAIRYLAKIVGLELPQHEVSEKEIEKYKEQDDRSRLLEVANEFFIESLSTDHEYRQYLEERGYKELVGHSNEGPGIRATKMEIGVIPSQEKLCVYLKNKDFALANIEQFFLKPNVDGELRKQPTSIGSSHKLSIPLRDPIGRIQGFAFRNINWTQESGGPSKYIYTAGLKKSSLLFNLSAVGGYKDLVVVEGLLDALHAKALGLNNVVALGGTSLNEAQVKLAKRHGAERITLCLDQDRAGENATAKAIEAINKSREKYKIYVATLPSDFKDPDELIRANGLEAFSDVIRTAKAHYLHLLDKRFDLMDQTRLKTGEIDDKDRDLLLEDVVIIGSQVRGPIESELFTEAFMKRGASLSVTKGSLEEAVERLQHKRERENQNKEFRETIVKAKSLADSGREQEAQELLDKHSKQLNTGILETSYRTLVKPITEAEVREALRHKPDHLASGLNFDGDLLYIPSGAITILAAPTSHGKTSFQINLALNMAENIKNKPVYFFSYEENREAILLKALNTYVNKPLSKNNRRSIESYFKTGNYEYFAADLKDVFAEERNRFFNDLIDTGKLNIHYVDYSAEELIEAIKYLHKHYEVGVIFIDYMQLLRLRNNRTSSRQEELKQVCLSLKDCSVDTGLPIILGAQFNRTVTDIEAIHSGAIGEAGDIERIANLIIGFWNKKFLELGKKTALSDEIYATVLKGRDMGSGLSETFDFNGNTGKISNKSHGRNMSKGIGKSLFA